MYLIYLSFFLNLFQVFYPGQSKPVFFVASRGHHADVGGIAPGNSSYSKLREAVIYLIENNSLIILKTALHKFITQNPN